MSPSTSAASADLLLRLAELSRRRPVWLRVGRLFDGQADRPLADADLVLTAREILYVGAGRPIPEAAQAPTGQSEPDALLPEYTALPCLIEAHAHLFLDGAPVDFALRADYLKQPAEWMLDRAQARWPKILKYGIATVRDAGDKHGVGLALAARAKERQDELAESPWIDSPGAAIHHRGRYGSFMGEPIEDFADEAACVDARVAQGADRIKLLVSGSINFKEGRVTSRPQMPVEEVAAITKAARRQGRQTFAHASGTDGVENSIEGGVTTVEHGFFITQDQLARMRDRRIGWVPTFAPVQAQIDRAAELGWDDVVVGHLRRIIEGHQRMLRCAHEMGVPIVAGSDAGSCGVPHGLGLLEELRQMEAAGVPTLAVLRAATGHSAELLAFAPPIGRLAPGRRARLILTRHDPTQTVANLQKEKTVLFDGVAVHDDGSLDVEAL